MKKFSLARFVFVVGLLFSVGQIWIFGPKLPDRVASHFGLNGVADGWSSSSMFVMTHGILTLFIAATFMGVNMLLRSAPGDLINLPNKAYYLAPERRMVTIDYLCDRILMFGASTIVLIATIFQLVYQSNLRGIDTIGTTPLLLLVMYLVYTALWSIGLVRRFSTRTA